jgi:glycosyltransferase involved in cell wall biosynthesis
MTLPTATLEPDSEERHHAFLASPRKHVLMITNHGVHQWRVIPGLPDTGGQNVFVNQFTDTMAKLGFRITIVNRGGYVHPVSGAWRRGIRYKDEHQRILYLEDGLPEFVRKEDMAGRMASLAESLKRSVDAKVDLIISHYWDGARLGATYNESLPEPVRHVWVPHSLGTVKKRNVSQDEWTDLRIDERIAVERSLVEEVDAIAATSSRIRQALQEDYGYRGAILFLPPCVDTDRFHPRGVPDADGVWGFLSQRSGLSVGEVRDCKIVTEISRTDTTKRKRVLIEAFARVRQRVPDSLLVVSIDAPGTGAESIVGVGAESTVDDNQERLAGELKRLIDTLDLQNHVAVVGSVWEELPMIYAVTDVYCTPSVMEGFGMSAQEAAATGVPVVASHLVPFVTEYLLGTQAEDVHFGGVRQPLRVGAGAIVVPADDVDGFARALEMLLTDDDLRKEMGRNAHDVTIPRFTWRNVVTVFLGEMSIDPGAVGG